MRIHRFFIRKILKVNKDQDPRGVRLINEAGGDFIQGLESSIMRETNYSEVNNG